MHPCSHPETDAPRRFVEVIKRRGLRRGQRGGERIVPPAVRRRRSAPETQTFVPFRDLDVRLNSRVVFPQALALFPSHLRHQLLRHRRIRSHLRRRVRRRAPRSPLIVVGLAMPFVPEQWAMLRNTRPGLRPPTFSMKRIRCRSPMTDHPIGFPFSSSRLFRFLLQGNSAVIRYRKSKGALYVYSVQQKVRKEGIM